MPLTSEAYSALTVPLTPTAYPQFPQASDGQTLIIPQEPINTYSHKHTDPNAHIHTNTSIAQKFIILHIITGISILDDSSLNIHTQGTQGSSVVMRDPDHLHS